jgi:hypothetical protein
MGTSSAGGASGSESATRRRLVNTSHGCRQRTSSGSTTDRPLGPGPDEPVLAGATSWRCPVLRECAAAEVPSWLLWGADWHGGKGKAQDAAQREVRLAVMLRLGSVNALCSSANTE